MYIQCSNIQDFCTLITTCSANGIKDIRVFISQSDSFKNSLRASNEVKDYKRFTYALFTPLYTAIYSNKVKDTEYQNIFKTLEDCQEQCNHDFYIQIFEKLSFNADHNYFDIEHELDSI